MRITKISVKKLFGIFDHEIPMHDSRITIIHGPNGFGKTILLTMIHGLFNSKYKVFSDVPFEEFRVEFENDEGIYIRPFLEDDDQERDDTSKIVPYQAVEPPYAFTICHSQGGENVYIPMISDKQSAFRRRVDAILELDRIGGNRWLDVRTGFVLTMEDIVEKYNLGSELYKQYECGWFEDVKKKISTTFIQEQRLQSQMISEPSRSIYSSRSSYRRREALAPIKAVKKYSHEIVDKIRTTSDVYEKRSQEKERSFPGRVIGKSSYPEFKDLQERLEELEKKRKDFMKLGLLDDDKKDTPDIPQLSSDQENTDRDLADLAKNFFSIYVQDIEDKLSEFDEISKQLRLLTEIINKRFQHKQLTIDKQKGFIIFPSDNDSIPITSLSSGEQHELVLFYRLLFHVQPNSLILIDEPELSLHVDWQRNFLNDIQRITDLRKFDVLMATHSPMIIQDKWDWMVGLGEPEGDS